MAYMTARGLTGRGGGRSGWLRSAPLVRAASNQVAGMFPWGVGASSPSMGTPVGPILLPGAQGGIGCCDPIAWFERKLIGNPSEFLFALPQIGKSTLLRRQMIGMDARGINSLVLGDLKGEHVDVIRAMGGPVFELGRGLGVINPVDITMAQEAAEMLTGRAREEALAYGYGRSSTLVSTLLTILRGERPDSREEAILDAALGVLYERHPHDEPTLSDLVQVIKDAPERVRQAALDRGEIDRYLDQTELIQSDLQLMTSRSGVFGGVFSGRTTHRLQRGTHAAFDISSIHDSEAQLQAGVLVACWSAGFSMVELSNMLTDAGAIDQELYFLVMDEIWRALRSGRGIVEQIETVTRINRDKGVSQSMASHSMADMSALADSVDRVKAKGFIERAGIKIYGGLPPAEMALIDEITPLSRKEKHLLIDWGASSGIDPDSGFEAVPPGRGKFLFKTGHRPGIPMQLQITEIERHLGDTNRRWAANTERRGVLL